MKRIWKYLIVLLILLNLALITVITIAINNNRTLKFNSNDIQSIIIVNNRSMYAKDVTNSKDFKMICDKIMNSDMNITKFLYHSKAGGESYTFIINYIDGNWIYIIYADPYLINNGKIYHLNSRELEELWDLEYEEREFHYAGFD